MKIYCVFLNTQLLLADKVRYKLQGDDSAIALKECLECYHLEAVFSDVRFSGKDDNLSEAA
jgi:hypothetical protein